MAFDDALIGSDDFDPQTATEDLIRQTAGGPLPVTLEPRMLNTRLGRKLGQPTPEAPPVDLSPDPTAAAPDFSAQATDAPPTPTSAPDFSAQAEEAPQITPPPAPPAPLGVKGEVWAGVKGVPHGALEHAGGIMQGASSLRLTTPTTADPKFLEELAASKDMKPAERAKLMGRAIRGISDRGLQMDYTAAMRRIAQGGDAAKEIEALRPKFEANNKTAAVPVSEYPLHKAGKAVKDFAQEVAPMTEQEKDSIGGRVGMGVGAIGPYALATVLGGPLAGMGAAAVGMATDTYGQIYESAKKNGADDETASRVAADAAGVAGILGSLPLGAGKLAAGLLKKMAVSGIAFSGTGEMQEYLLQQIAKTYDPKAGYTVDEKRIIAALILGIGMGGLHHAFDRSGQPQPGQQPGAQPAGPGAQMPPPGPQPGAGPQGWPGGTGSWGTPPPGGGPQPGAGPGAGAGTPPPGGGAGPRPGGPGAQQQAPGGGAGPQPGAQPGGPPPGTGTGTGKAGDPNYRMDPATRAKMERVYRHFERGKDPSKLSDGELFDLVNDHLRDTSSTGHTAKPETPEEAAAREGTARRRDEDAELKAAFAWMTDAQIASMTPEARDTWLTRARGGKPEAPGEQPQAQPKQPEKAAASPDDARAAADADARKAGFPNADEIGPDTYEPIATERNRELNDRDLQSGETPVVEPQPTSKSDVPRATGTRGDPIEIRTAEDVAAVTAPASGDYTHAQGEANNRQLGHGKWNGRAVRMEVAKGGTRKMLNPETGEPVDVTHAGAAYGYFPGTTGADGMHVDLIMGDNPESPDVYVIDEIDRKTGKFRQHKVVGGTLTEQDAFSAYVQISSKGPETVGGITKMSVPEVFDWLDNGDTTKALKPPSPGPDKTDEGGSRPLTEATGEAPKETPAAEGAQRGGSDPIMREDRGGSVQKRPPSQKSDEPLSLLQFIASKGGLAPHPELSALGFDGKRRVQIPGRKGFFGVVRPGGMSLDYMREAIEEAGYLRGEAGQTSTIRQLLDAMSEEDRGNRLDAEGNEGTLSKREQSLAREREEYERERHEIEYGTATADLIEAGYTGLRNDLHDAAVRLMVDEGLSPDDAVERAAVHLTATDPVYAAPDYDVTHQAIRDTFGGGAYDEIRPAAAPEDGERPSRQREEGARPGEGQEDRGDGTDVPDSGAKGRETAGEVAQARAEVEAALGPDADLVLPVDIARAAEIMSDNPGMTPETAFGQAVAVGSVEQGFLTQEQAEAAYGPEINDVLESGQEGAPVRAGDVEQERAEPDEIGSGGAAQGGELPGRGKARGQGAEDQADRPVAKTAAGKAGAAAGRDEAARDETGDADQDRVAAEGADQPVGEFIADIERRIADGDYDADIAPTRSISDLREAAEARGWVHGAYGKGKALWSPDRKHAMLYHVAVEGNYVNVQWGEPTEGVTPPQSAKVQAADSDETVTVTLSREGPWDFNDTFPAPDPKQIAALERDGRSPFDDPSNAAEVASAVDAGVYDMIEEMGTIRAADAEIAGVRAGKIKLKKKETAADRIAELTKARAKAVEMLRGHQGTFEDVFGKDATRAMMKEARRRLVQEEGQRDKGVDRKVPEQAEVDRDGKPLAVGDVVEAINMGGHAYKAEIDSFATYQGRRQAIIRTENGSTAQPFVSDLKKLEGEKLTLRPKPKPPKSEIGGGKTKAQRAAESAAKRAAKHDWSEYPDGKKPAEFMGRPVPENAVPWKEAKAGDVLVSGMVVIERKIDRKARAESLAKEVGGTVLLDGKRHWAVVADQPRAEPAKPKNFDDMTAADKKAARDAPTWAEILAELPMHKDGRTREHEIAFAIMKEIANRSKFNDLTPEQKHQLLERVKGLNAKTAEPAPAKDDFDAIFDTAVEEQFGKPEPTVTTEAGADNKPQMVIPGAEKASDGTMAKRAAAAPLKPKAAQRPADIGLFGDESKQSDMMDMLAKAPPPPQGGGMSLDDVSKGLGALFGKKPPGLSEPEPVFLDDTYRQALPYFKAGVAHFAGGDADLTTMVRALVKHLAGAGMDADAIRAMKPYIKRFTEDVTAGRESLDAPSGSDVLESGGGKPEAGDPLGETNVPPPAGGAGRRPRGRGKPVDAADQRPGSGERLPQDHAPVVGEDGNLELPAREPVDEGGDAADRERARGAPDGEEGFPFDDGANDDAIKNAQKDADVNARRERQRQAEGIEVIDADLANIADTLPMLHPEQHGDVLAAEQRFAKPDGHGMLFTNGTGTGKTYSGLGIIKRFTKKGKGQILVVAPSQGILTDWMRSAKDLGLDMNILESTVDKGRPGLNGTTYANLGDNRHLVDNNWNLVVADEAHKLSSDQDGTKTKALATLRALTYHPDGLRTRAEMKERAAVAQIESLPESQRGKAWAALEPKIQWHMDKWFAEKKPRPKALMMSATPFAYHFSLDYAEGYLFEFDRSKDSNGGYNAPTGRDAFYMQHLGYRKRVGKLTKPDADVKSEIMERQLHEYLKKTGALSGLALTVDKDYDRKFVLAHNAAGELIDRALNFLQEAESGRYRPLHERIAKQFDYLARMRLLEAMKAQDAIGYIKEAHALGRKVVVFHDYNEGGGISPFTVRPSGKQTIYLNGEHVELDLGELYDDFARQNPYIKELDFGKYPAPIYTLTQAFPNALVYNGNIPNKKRDEAKRLFNDDNSGHDLIIVQSAAGEAGISLHDTTGKKQRVLLNLGMPIRPTTSIQQEGRIYRVGQSSDAIFRYMNTGTDWERWTFAGKIADRAGTAENLALGNLARTIRQSFIDAFSNAGDYRPEPGEGKGGKELDRATTTSISEYEKAKTHYFAQAKVTGRRDQREGIDYYATPEPVGLKMVEFANLKPGEKILEPSAGHGAIARYFPEDSARTLVEPSSSLASRAALTTPGARVVVDRFENLDVGANKFDAIVMNPPFGHAGAEAVRHVTKAMKHLKNGGRIVALVPDGAINKITDGKDWLPGMHLTALVDLPTSTFERAGTAVKTTIMVIDKHTDDSITLPYRKHSNYSGADTIKEFFDRFEGASVPDRIEPLTKDAEPTAAGVVTIDGIELKIGPEGNPGAVVYVDLKNKIGIDKFKRVMRTAEANEGRYIKTLKSIEFRNATARDKFLEALRNPPAEPEQPSAPSGVTFKTGETKHAKTGADLFVATPQQRVERDVYDMMAAAAKTHGGWYSSYKGRGAIPGFQFKSAEARKKFLDQMGGGLGEPQRPALHGERGQQWTLEQGRKTGTEYLIAYGADGREVSRSGGTLQRFVAFTPEFIKELSNPDNDIVAHHNHPSGTSLSHTDLMALAYSGLRAVWAHGNNGNIYRAEQTAEFAALSFPTPNARSKKIEALYQHVKWRLQPIIQEAVNLRTVTVDEANGGINHLINEVLADAGIFDYRSNYELGDFVSRVKGLSDTLKNAAVAARKEAFGDTANSNRVDRRAGPLRHAGDLGATFDRAGVATPVGGEGRRSPLGEESDFDEAPGSEAGPGLAQPDNTFKKPGSFDSSIGDILRSRVLGRMSDLNATEARVQLQDKFARVKNAEESVGAPSTLSAYQAESLYYGRTGHRLEQLRENHIDPIIREMKARDVELEKFDDFLSASHAPERNNKIGAMYQPGHQFHRAMTDHDVVGGSGWSTNEALRVIRDLRASGKLNDYLAVARMVWALNFRTRRALYDAGLIDRDTFDAWNAAYKYYTPQRGHAEGDLFMNTSSGMNVRGKEARTAFGRRSKADSPLAYSIMQAEMAIIRAEKKKVGNTFLQFVRANPDPARWTVDRPPLVKRIDPATGLVTSMPNNLYADHDNVFTTKENGKDVYITLHGPDGLNLARALKNMGTANVHKFIRAYSTVTHTMAKMATAWNPEFMIPNLARDLGEAFINLSAQQQRNFVRKFVGHLAGAMKGSSKAIAIGHNGGPPLNDPYVDAFNRFDAAGGRIRFFGIDDPDAIETNVNKRLARLDGGALNTAKDFADQLGKALEIAGGGIENATRLAAFMAAEDVGMSQADAAMLARNLTVDFNKKGELGGAISALYMFANAGIQGQARMIRALGHRRVWMAVGALAAASALSTLFSILNGETDEAGTPAYMKVPPWERDKNLIFMLPSGRYIKIPLPYGFSMFGVAASRVVTTLMGHDKPGTAASAVMHSIINAFNPLGEESSMLMDIIPSAIRPAFHIWFNKNWTGKPLYPDQNERKGERPDSTQSFKNDSAFSKEAARLLNEWSGGSAYKPGYIDVHPASIDHTLQAITGGVGRFAKGIADSFYRNVVTGEEWQPEKTPILRRFTGKIGPEHDAALFYEARKQVRDEQVNIAQAKKDRRTGTNLEDANEHLKDSGPAYAQKSIFERADKQMTRLREQQDRINASTKSPEEKRTELEQIRQEMRKVQNAARAESIKLRQGASP